MLEELKNYLKLEDDDLDIASLNERGKKYLSRMTGTSLDFEKEDLPKQLLFDYCRYAINNSLEFFTQNFADDILSLSLQEAVKAMGSEAIING